MTQRGCGHRTMACGFCSNQSVSHTETGAGGPLSLGRSDSWHLWFPLPGAPSDKHSSLGIVAGEHVGSGRPRSFSSTFAG